jgi:hypothetical protein
VANAAMSDARVLLVPLIDPLLVAGEHRVFLLLSNNQITLIVDKVNNKCP